MSDSNDFKNSASNNRYRYLAFAMALVSVGRQEWWGYESSQNILIRINSKLWKLIGPFIMILEIIYGYLYFDILKKTNMVLSYFISLAVYGIAFIKLFSAQKDVYRVCLTNFMKEFHLYHFLDKNNYNRKIAISVERLSHYIRCFFFLSIFVDATMWVITPTTINIMHLEEIHNKTMILQGATYIWMPFDYIYNFRNWIIFQLFCAIYLQFGLCVVIFCVDTMTFNFMLHIIGHLDILKHDIETQNWDVDDSNVREKLIIIHEHYTFIKRNFKTFQAAYGLNIGAIFLFNLISDSLLMYLLMLNAKENLMLYLLMALYFLTNLIALSYATEKIRKLSEDVFIAIYSCPWECMSVSNQKVLLLILVQSQELLDFKACGFAIGYRPMISIIKTTFSYYVMLKETNE